jgi:iron complex outermembrane recepter protein
MKKLYASTILAGGFVFSAGALAQEALPAIDVGAPQPFQLGQTAVGEQKGAVDLRPPVDKNADNGPLPRQRTDALGGVTISNRQIETFAKETLDQAVNLAAGVNSETTGTARNEQNIYVRGFDRWQVPVTVDGVRVYLPQDNRLDFARFTTPDIAEIQISEGYVSVLDGPGGMGGLINLVSRKPTREIDTDLRSRLDLGRDGTYEGILSSAYVGTKQQNYYAQVSGTWRDMKGWMLPESFGSAPDQGWGFRQGTGTYDWNVNAKVAWTPNATDEYSLSFRHQEGKKGAPYNVVDPLSSQSAWNWPYWNTQSLYFLSNTKLGDSSYVKTKAYWNKFDNDLVAYSNQWVPIQNTPAAFNSVYNDYALGAGVEAGTVVAGVDTVKASLEYRLDAHNAWQQYYAFKGFKGCTPNVVCYTQPITTTLEDTYSAAIENTYHPTPQIDLVQGFSYDWRHLRQAQDFNSSLPTPSSPTPFGVVNYPVNDGHAPNFQGAAIYHYTDKDNIHANVSDRERFPTLFERFSTRFGGATSNPGLEPERAINFDIGWSSEFAPRSKVTVDLFYSVVRNLIQSVPVPAYGPGVTQSQNVGDGHYFGGEATVDYAVRDDFSLGGNLTVIHRQVYAPYILNFQPIGVPDLKVNLFAGYRPLPELTLTPSLELDGSRWTVTDIIAPIYYRTGAFAVVNMNAEYQATKNLTFSAGVRNVFDAAYILTYGYPEPGRSIYLGVKATF